MIVKNEGKIIERCLKSTLGIISSYLVHDTGSTDGTPDLIRKFFSEHGIEGEVKVVPWADFGTNRSNLVADGRETAKAKGREDDYLLLADADYEFRVSPGFSPKKLDADAYYLAWDGNLFYRNIKLIKASLPWVYRGKTHEYITLEEGSDKLKPEIYSDIKIFEYSDGGNRPDKYARDKILLHKSLEEDPNDARSLFYLGRTHDDLGEYDDAIKWYRKRVECGGWYEEVFYAQYRIGKCMMSSGAPLTRFGGELLQAYVADPARLEPIYALIRWCRENEHFGLGYNLGSPHVDKKMPTDRMLFLDSDVWSWRLKDEVAVCAYYVGRKDISRKYCKQLLDSGVLPESEIERITKNMNYE